MIKIKPKFIYDDNGKKMGVALMPEDFEIISDMLEDYHDVQDVLRSRKKKEKTYTLEQVRSEIFGKK